VSAPPCLVLLAGIQLLECKWNSFCEFNIKLVWPALLAQVLVTMSSTDFSFQNLVFWNLFEFSAAEIT
jgi:hypothetical protein